MSRNREAWSRLVESHKAFTIALQQFFEQGVDRVSVLRSALRSNDKFTAISVVGYLPKNELLQLFPELLHLASFSHGAIETVRGLIRSLPLEWVLENIENMVEPLLVNGDEEEYRRFLELYTEIDGQMALRLANRALQSSDQNIRGVGEDFISLQDKK